MNQNAPSPAAGTAVAAETAAAARPPRRALPPEQVARIAEAHFGEPVIRITAPGGRSRDSVRVHFSAWTAIASRRENPRRIEREAAFLAAMSRAGAPVPEFLGAPEGVLFQSDLGSTRLTAELTRTDGSAREALVASAFESLWQIKDAARSAGFLAEAPPIATGDAWLRRFVGQPARLAEVFGRPAPDFDAEAAAGRMKLPAQVFIKWDARPGNASLGPDGKVRWFDWEDYGRRGGTEDFAFLIGDEFWPVGAAESLRIFSAGARIDPDRASRQLALFATFCVLQRLRYIREQWKRHGWMREDRARRYDRIGTVPDLIAPLTARGAHLADLLPETRPLARWIGDLADPGLWRHDTKED